MKVAVSLLPALEPVDATTDLAVVIDVLRATSVMATAFAAGAQSVVTCREVSVARAMADARTPRPLLCGERECRPIDGFDLGNSPAEYTPHRMGGRHLVLTTTNGTAAIDAARGARRLVTASFLNFFAVSEVMRAADNVHLICAGTEGHITLEDVLLAGALLTHAEQRNGAEAATDQAVLASLTWRSWFGGRDLPAADELAVRLRETRGGRNLVRQGYAEDIFRCSLLGSISAVPQRINADPATFENRGN